MTQAERARVFAWYAPRRRRYPWRSRPTPYRVLVSEFMLQQTQASRVVPVYRRFLKTFPSIRALAEASRADVVRAWAGLGYNRRAVALHETARAIVGEHGGRIPRDPDALRQLPGIGPYTAAAVACHAYRVPAAGVDTNIRRVVARARLGRDPHAASAVEVQRAASDWVDRSDPAGWSQALMDLGHEICRPNPRCESCPIAVSCAFLRSGRRPRSETRRQSAFEGSTRQLRGRVVSALRDRSSVSVGELARATGEPIERIAKVAVGLVTDGLVRAGPAALAGRSRGLLRLAG